MTAIEEPERETSERAQGPTPPADRKKVLIIEDNTDAGRVLTMMVSRMGHDVQYAVNGNVGWAYVKLFRPDVILLDLNLPGMNGYEVCRRVKEDPTTRHARIIIVSAYGDEEARARAKAAGASSHLVKPIEPAVLEHLLSF
jgi:CheY-like chemotaxis protein